MTTKALHHSRTFLDALDPTEKSGAPQVIIIDDDQDQRPFPGFRLFLWSSVADCGRSLYGGNRKPKFRRSTFSTSSWTKARPMPVPS